MGKFKDILVTAARTSGVFIKNHEPEIVMGIGAAASVGAVVLACKATIDIQEPLEEAKERIRETKAGLENGYYEDYPEESYKKDLTEDYINMTKVVVKHFALPVALEAAALGAMFCSNKKWKERTAGLATSLAAVQGMYDKYRANVIDQFGEDVDRDMRLGIKRDQIAVEEEDPETGKTITKMEEALTIDSTNGLPSIWARVFDESSYKWCKSRMCNRDTLILGQGYLTELLCAQGYLFVNDVYDYFDLPKCEEGQYYGWIYDPKRPIGNANYIDLHLVDVTDVAKNNFMNGIERNCLIDLQPDGYIADKVWPKVIRGGDFKHIGRGSC